MKKESHVRTDRTTENCASRTFIEKCTMNLCDNEGSALPCTTAIKLLTTCEHECTLADAVVIIHVFCAKVSPIYHQTALSASRTAVALQKQPNTERQIENETVFLFVCLMHLAFMVVLMHLANALIEPYCKVLPFL